MPPVGRLEGGLDREDCLAIATTCIAGWNPWWGDDVLSVSMEAGTTYFIVVDAHMLSLDHNLFPDAERIVTEDQENWSQYWQRFEQTWRWRREQFDRGLIEITVSDTELTADSIPNDKGLAMPAASDSFNDYAVVTGWRANE